MKRLTVCLLALFLLMPAVTVLAAAQGPVITQQPQSPNYPDQSVAIYTVKAEGSNLTAIWYMEWLGSTYTISDLGGAMQPWEPFAGEAYGPRQPEAGVFTFIFEGIEADLDGAYIWCVIEDGYNDAASQKVRINVGNPNLPPEILSIPVSLTVTQGEQAELRCTAKSPDGSQLSFLWYESDTGLLQDIRAVNRGEETSDYLFCDTSIPGTRNYMCLVQTENGGLTYSSFVPVTVTEKPAAPPETTPPTEPATTPSTEPATIPSTAPATEATQAPTASEPEATQPQRLDRKPAEKEEGIPSWALVLIGAASALAGVCVALILVNKKS